MYSVGKSHLLLAVLSADHHQFSSSEERVAMVSQAQHPPGSVNVGVPFLFSPGSVNVGVLFLFSPGSVNIGVPFLFSPPHQVDLTVNLKVRFLLVFLCLSFFDPPYLAVVYCFRFLRKGWCVTEFGVGRYLP